MIAADCTLIAQFFLTTPETELSRQVAAADNVWLVPPLWRSELRSVLRKYLLRNEVSLEHCIEVTFTAEAMLSASEVHVSSADVMNLVATSSCSAYDAEYIALAKSFAVPIVTSDRRLCKLFPAVAVSPAEFLSAFRNQDDGW